MGFRITERSPLAKAAAGLLVAVGKTTRGFKSLPSPPNFRLRASFWKREFATRLRITRVLRMNPREDSHSVLISKNR